MSSSVLSSNSCCGPVTGLLGNQTFLLHAQPQQKTISPPLWRTFYTPPPTDVSKSPITLTPSPNAQQTFINNNIQTSQPGDLPAHRMTLQKLPNSIIEQTTQQSAAAAIQKSSTSIMSVSKLVRPTPKNQHTHHMHHHQQHVALQQHSHQHQHQHQQHQHQHQHNGTYNTDVQLGPMNLVTNSQSADSSRSRPSSTASSVDIESDDIPESQQQQTVVPMSPAAVYQLNYSHLYANKSGYHSNAVAAAADTLRLHASYSYAAIAAVAAATASSTNNNIFPMNAMSPPSLSHHQNTPTAAHLSLPSPLSSLTSTAVTTTALPTNASPRLIDHHQSHHQPHHHHQQHQQQQQHQHQYHHHQQQEQLKQQLNSANENMFSPPLPTALSNGTYLNSKSSPASDAESSTENYFKVPNTNGKEGSLKHRILTRPASLADKEEKPPKNPVISTYNSTANFKKGSCIELANGVLRRVEDMRTEDFIQCAERSLHLQLAESTIVKIDSTKPQVVVITFSYDRNRSKADIEVSIEHPFFVYGQGWASCDPERSHKAFGLKCQRLQVGDICISLTQRNTLLVPAATIKTEIISKEINSKDAMRYAQTELPQSCDGLAVPISIKSEFQPVMPPPPLSAQQVQYPHPGSSANSTVVHRVPTAAPPPMHFMPCHLPATSLPHPHQITYADFPDLVSAAAAYNSSAHLHHLPTVMPPPPSPDAINGFYQQTQQLFLQGKVTASDLRLQPPSSSHSGAHNYCPPRNSSLLPPPQPPPAQSPMLEHTQEQPFDASIASRKRRWSASDHQDDCDDGENRRDHCQNANSNANSNSKLYKSVIAPVTT